MAIQDLPIRFEGGRSRLNYEITLDDRQFLFRIVYQERSDSWYLTIRLIDFTLLRAGIRLVPDWPLSLRDVDARLPSGTLWLIRLDDKEGPPNFEDFGEGNVALLRITEDDLIGGELPAGITLVKQVAV